LEQDVVRRLRGPHRIVRQNKFMQLRIVRRRIRFHFRFSETFRFRISIRIKNCHWHGASAWPKAEAAHFLRVSFARNCVRQMRNAAGMLRRGASGKTSDREIRRAPEKMDWAAFPAEARAKFLEDA